MPVTMRSIDYNSVADRCLPEPWGGSNSKENCKHLQKERLQTTAKLNRKAKTEAYIATALHVFNAHRRSLSSAAVTAGHGLHSIISYNNILYDILCFLLITGPEHMYVLHGSVRSSESCALGV